MEIDKIKKQMCICYQYRHLFQQLVSKDIKLKYRRSFLGYLWSILNPLFTMLVMIIVFSHMFRFDIENYPVYLIIGQTIFNFLNESTTMAIYSITGNAALIKKVYVPKYIFTISRVTSSMVNFLFSLLAMVLVFFFCGIQWNLHFLFIPMILLQVYVFCIGLGLFLAQAAVFFRDIQYIYNVLLTAWMYLTPIFYPIASLPKQLQDAIIMFNPMYDYIMQFRVIVLEGVFPDGSLILKGSIVAFLVFGIGLWSFSKSQDHFILYI